jgi:hypothetical protein
MAASLKDKRTPITTPPYQEPSVDVTPDPAIFSLVTTFKQPTFAGYTFLPGGSGGHGGVKEKMSIVGFLCVAEQKKSNSQQAKGDI